MKNHPLRSLIFADTLLPPFLATMLGTVKRKHSEALFRFANQGIGGTTSTASCLLSRKVFLLCLGLMLPLLACNFETTTPFVADRGRPLP